MLCPARRCSDPGIEFGKLPFRYLHRIHDGGKCVALLFEFRPVRRDYYVYLLILTLVPAKGNPLMSPDPVFVFGYGLDPFNAFYAIDFQPSNLFVFSLFQLFKCAVIGRVDARFRREAVRHDRDRCDQEPVCRRAVIERFFLNIHLRPACGQPP